MKSYKYLTIGSPSHLEVECTDEQVLEWIVSLVREAMPSCENYYNFPIGKTRTNFKNYQVHITKLDDKDTEVQWWLMEQLGQQGWEPFQVGARVHFRLEIEKEVDAN